MTKIIACAHKKGRGKDHYHSEPRRRLGPARGKVLLLDADPQGDLSKRLGVKGPEELKQTISTVMDYLISHSDEDNYRGKRPPHPPSPGSIESPRWNSENSAAWQCSLP